MRQGNGSDLLGANDPRNSTIGIIYVAPNDGREDVLAAILTQEKLGRKQLVIVLPEENKAFQRPVDFDGLKNIRRRLQAQLIIVTPADSSATEFARQRRFPVYSSLEAYAGSLPDADQSNGVAKQRGRFGGRSTRPTPPAAPDPGEPDQEEALPVPPEDSPEQHPGETGDMAGHQADANADDDTILPDVPRPRQTRPLSPVPDNPRDEQIIYVGPEEEIVNVREHLERVQARRIILVVPPQAHLRSHVGWRLLHAWARELGKEVMVLSSDRQMRAVAKAAGFRVVDSLDASPSGRTGGGGRPVRPRRGRGIPPGRIPQKVYPPPPRRDQPDQHLVIPGDQYLSPQEPQPPANDTSASPVTNPADPVADPFAFDEDTLPPPLPEQYGSAPINATGEDVPGITDESGVAKEDYKIEDLGDLEDFLPSPDSSPEQPLPPLEDESQAEDEPWRPVRPTLRSTQRKYRTEKPPEDEPTEDASQQPIRPQVRRRPLIDPSDDELLLRPRRPVPPTQPKPPGPTVRRPQSPIVTPPRSGRERWFYIIPLIVIILLLLGYFVSNTGLFHGSAVVTITPARVNLRDTYVISAVSGVPIASQRQVQARLLSYTTSSQTETVKATGSGNIPALAARGSLTFYNALSYPQTIAAGTVFMDSNGVQVANDTTVSLPAAHPPTEGVASVAAHALNSGVSGNIPAFDFNNLPCCTSGITVQNATPFSGGRDQVNYTFVQQSDIDNVVNALNASLIPAAQTALKTQIRPNEQLIAPVQCAPAVNSNHAAGDKAASVTVTVTGTCSGEVYDQQGARSLAAMLLRIQAVANLATGYALAGDVATSVVRATVAGTNKSTVMLFVSAGGLWVYRFSNVQKQELARLVAGKSANDAQTLLAHQIGVAKADVGLPLFNTTLPTSPDAITMVVQSVP